MSTYRGVPWGDVGDRVGLAMLICIGVILRTDVPVSITAPMLLAGVACGMVSPAASVSAMVIAAPFVFDPVSVAERSFSLLELAVVAGSVGIAARLVADGLWRRSVVQLVVLVRPLSVSTGLALFGGAALMSLATLADPGHRPESLREFRLVIVEPLMFLVACRFVFSRPEGRLFVVHVLAALGAVVGVTALSEVLFRDGGVVADGIQRATGPYPHPNNLALFLERIGVFSICLALFGSWRRWWFGVAGILALAGVGATFSRGAAIAVVVGMLVVLLARGRTWAVWMTVGLAVVFAAVTLLAVGDRVFDTGSTGSESTRLLIWRSSLRMALDHPVWGVGLDQFLTQYWPRYVEPAGWPERYTSHAHNLVLDVWLRLGLFGLGAAGWLIVVVWRLAVGALRSRQTVDAAAAGAVAALATGLVHGMVDNGFFLPDLALLTWLSIVLLESSPKTVAPGNADTSLDGMEMGIVE